jgi:hypothetical protein
MARLTFTSGNTTGGFQFTGVYYFEVHVHRTPPPPPPVRKSLFNTVEEAVLHVTQGQPLGDWKAIKLAYKRTAKAMHPDSGGSHEDFVKLQEAYAICQRYFGK